MRCNKSAFDMVNKPDQSLNLLSLSMSWMIQLETTKKEGGKKSGWQDWSARAKAAPTLMKKFPFLFQVSWIRKSDLHVLTSDVLTFTSDQRFSSHHAADSDSWILQIKSTQMRDSGEFQCQVNTEPKISFSVFLSVKGIFGQREFVTTLSELLLRLWASSSHTKVCDLLKKKLGY